MEIGNNASSSIFDDLPDELVVIIVDKLGWKDTAKASVLSHRFHHASKFCSAIKNLDFENQFSGNNSRLKFVEFVNHSLQKHQHPKANSLRIAFDPRINYTETITDEAYSKLNDGYENWLRFARSKCVENLHIELIPVYRQYSSGEFRPKFPILEGWDKLTSLTLNIAELADEDLDRALKGNIVNLELLSIQNAPGLTNVVIESPKLKKLEFIGCAKILSIDIHSAPNLTCFRFEASHYGEPRNMVDFKGAPMLSHVCLGGNALRKENVVKLNKVARLEKLELLDEDVSKRTMAKCSLLFSNRWDNLTALSLRSIRVEDEDLKHDLKGYLVNLESLFVQNASGLKNVVIAFPKLKQLEIKDCRSVCSIDIVSAPNLQCFVYQGCSKLRNVMFKDVPKLTHVSLDSGSYCQKSLLELEKVEMLEKLEMKLAPRCDNENHVECVRNPRHFPVLGNLKELECRFVVSEESCIPMILTVILASCPKLHKLTLNCMTNEESRFSWLDLKKDRWFCLSEDNLRDGPDMNHRLHLCLKKIKFLGGCTEENKVEAVNYLKRIAPNFNA